MDVLLSSGFLAFARHLGFRRELLAQSIDVTGICGTSSGAVVGALWASGMSEADMISLLNVPRPLSQVDFDWRIWKGLFVFNTFKETLRSVLPERIEDLAIPFGVGLCTMDRKAVVVTEGNLVDAIAASCAVPYLFHPMPFADSLYRDGGFADRIGAVGWAATRETRHPIIAHIVNRSKGVANEEGLEGAQIVRTPRSFATLWSIGDFMGQLEEAAQITQDHFASRAT